MFNFRIIDTPDGDQVIDQDLKTPYESLTPLQRLEYTDMENMLYFIECEKRKEEKAADRQRKLARNPFYRLACLCGIV